MEIEKFIGFKFDTIKKILDDNSIKYNLIEAWDTKGTKIGDELRIIKVENSEVLNIYVSYF